MTRAEFWGKKLLTERNSMSREQLQNVTQSIAAEMVSKQTIKGKIVITFADGSLLREEPVDWWSDRKWIDWTEEKGEQQ